MIAANGHVYVMGGFDPFALTAQYQIYRAKIKVDGSLEAWEELATTPLPQALENHTTVATNLYLLALGGRRENQSRDSVYLTSLYRGVQQANFTHQFDLGSVQDMGVLDWQAQGDPEAVLNVLGAN